MSPYQRTAPRRGHCLPVSLKQSACALISTSVSRNFALSSTKAIQQKPKRCARLPFSKRSEEHTSELQSLMRISYAVFCLKKTIPSHITSYRHNNILNLQDFSTHTRNKHNIN